MKVYGQEASDALTYLVDQRDAFDHLYHLRALALDQDLCGSTRCTPFENKKNVFEKVIIVPEVISSVQHKVAQFQIMLHLTQFKCQPSEQRCRV